jgi:hypothetical protein
LLNRFSFVNRRRISLLTAYDSIGEATIRW